jgi:hypothetical protein
MKETQICWTGSQGEYDDPASLSQLLILVLIGAAAFLLPPAGKMAIFWCLSVVLTLLLINVPSH